jgi:mono/diheme cytochrome c family protein
VPQALLAVALFIVLFVVLALGVVLIGIRGGGSRRTTPAADRSSNRLVGVSFVVMLIGFAIVLPALLLTGNHSNASAEIGGMKLTQGQKTGRELFGDHCAVCHTLGAANAVGKIGPNLDTLKPPESLVLHTINNGCLPNASGSNSSEQCLGQGVMPANIVQGQDAQNVASFVARVAGKE